MLLTRTELLLRGPSVTDARRKVSGKIDGHSPSLRPKRFRKHGLLSGSSSDFAHLSHLFPPGISPQMIASSVAATTCLQVGC